MAARSRGRRTGTRSRARARDKAAKTTRTLHWFDLDGRSRMPFVGFGDPRGSPVVILPGLSDGLAPLSDKAVLERVPPPPRELLGYRSLVVSHRHPLPSEVTTEALAADVVAFIEEQTTEPVILTGHSMGAMIAEHVAVMAPDRIRAVALSAAVPAAHDQLREIIGRWELLVREERWLEFYRDAVASSYTGTDRLRRLLALRVLGATPRPRYAARHLALSHACRSHDAVSVLGAIRAPTLVLGGSADRIAPPEQVGAVAAAIPDARLVSFDGLAHGFPEQGRKLYLRALIDFLEALPVARP